MKQLDFQKRLTISTVSVVAVIFVAVMSLVFVVASNNIISRATKDSQSDVDHVARLIDDDLQKVESAIRNAVFSVQTELHFHEPDSLQSIVEEVVRNNPGIIGSAIAMAPHECPTQNECFMLYSYDDGRNNIISHRPCAGGGYNYLTMPWYALPMSTRKPAWSEPYFDKGGGNMLMCTYSYPIMCADSCAGVITADISLDDIYAQMTRGNYLNGPERDMYIESRAGILVYHPDFSLVMKHAPAAQAGDDISFSAAIPAAGWTICETVSRRQLLMPFYRSLNYMVILSIFTLVVLYLAVSYAIKRMSRPEMERQARINAELNVARRLQDGLLSRSGKPGTETTGVQTASLMLPAKEIGGDTFYYAERNGMLHFMIADVSGKGIPAAMFMVTASELYASLIADNLSPAQTAAKLNNILCTDNAIGMFATAIIGRLDLVSRLLTLCNAGHNPPVVAAPPRQPSLLYVNNNIPLGVVSDFPFAEEETALMPGTHLLLYTDGVTEAEDKAQGQFGDTRLLQAVKDSMHSGAQAVITTVKSRIDAFIGRQEQSDDITMLDILYQGIPHNGFTAPCRMESLEELYALAERTALPDKALVALEEAVTNVICYSSASRFAVSIAEKEGRTVMTVTDDGTPFDPTAYTDARTADPDMLAVGGQGIKLMKSILHALSYRRANNYNILILDYQHENQLGTEK